MESNGKVLVLERATETCKLQKDSYRYLRQHFTVFFLIQFHPIRASLRTLHSSTSPSVETFYYEPHDVSIALPHLVSESTIATNAAKNINSSTTASFDEFRFRSRSTAFEGTMKQMSLMTLRKCSENDDQQLLFYILAAGILDSKRRSRLSLFRDCVMSVKKWIENIEMRMLEVHELLNILDT